MSYRNAAAVMSKSEHQIKNLVYRGEQSLKAFGSRRDLNMRTNEERSRLIHKRTAEIKREKQNRIQRGLDAVCIAVCLLLVTGIGAWMPELMTEPAAGNIVHSSGAASMIGSHAALGYIVMGLLAFLLGVCVTVLLYRLRLQK